MKKLISTLLVVAVTLTTVVPASAGSVITSRIRTASSSFLDATQMIEIVGGQTRDEGGWSTRCMGFAVLGLFAGGIMLATLASGAGWALLGSLSQFGGTFLGLLMSMVDAGCFDP